MESFRRAGKTMLMISHDLETIKRISHRILFLDRGRILGLGDPYEMIDQYDAHSLDRGAAGLRREWGTGAVVIQDVEVRNDQGNAASVFQWGEPMAVRMRYLAKERVVHPVFGFAFSDGLGRPVYGNNTQIESVDLPFIEGEGAIEFRIEELRMGRGEYLLSLSVHSSDHKTNYHRLDHCFAITVEAEKPFEGCYMPVRWSP
jgi:ABC-2 type transport system ATP-binding protein/lipopolysaccharide transport system ATP-binding protein